MEQWLSRRRYMPMGRLGTVEEVAAVALFLARARALVGDFRLDGGETPFMTSVTGGDDRRLYLRCMADASFNRNRTPLAKSDSWGETVGTLTKNGLLDIDLVLDWLWVSGLWTRVGPAAVKLREKHGVPELYENFEALAKRQG